MKAVARFSTCALPLLAFATSSFAQAMLPNEFEPGSPAFGPLSSYFGGVGSFGVRPSTATVFSGNSLEVWANFQPDAFFNIAGVQVGALDLPRSSLTFPANANTFSLTVRPPTIGRLQMIVTLSEDDDGDGIFDAESDDRWETSPIVLATTASVYNIPLTSFTHANPGAGNGIMQLGTTPHLGVAITFETRASLPGGVIEQPVTLQIDHVGLFVGNQTIPAASCPADLDNGSGAGVDDGAVEISDLLYFISKFELGHTTADLDNGSMNGVPDQAVTIEDLLFFLVHFEGGC